MPQVREVNKVVKISTRVCGSHFQALPAAHQKQPMLVYDTEGIFISLFFLPSFCNSFAAFHKEKAKKLNWIY